MIQENMTFELNLTDDQKQLLIDYSYQEAKKWYEYMTEYSTKETVPQVDMMRAIDLYYDHSKIFNQLTNRDWIEDFKLVDLLCLDNE